LKKIIINVGAMATVALVAGFVGVVIAVAPWSHEQRIDLIGLVSCLVCVVCFSINMVWSRVLTRTEPPESLAFFSGLVTAVGVSVNPFIEYYADNLPQRRLGVFGIWLLLCGFALQSLQYWVAILDIPVT